MLYRSDFQWNFNVNKWSLTYAVNALICRIGLGVLHRITHEVRLQVFMLVTGSHVVHTNTNNSIKILLPYCKVTNCVTQCDYPFLLGFHGGYWTDCHLGFDTSRILHCQWCLHTQHNRSGHTFSHTHCSDSDTDCSVIDLSANPYITVLNHLMDCDILHDKLMRFSLFWGVPEERRSHLCPGGSLQSRKGIPAFITRGLREMPH